MSEKHYDMKKEFFTIVLAFLCGITLPLYAQVSSSLDILKANPDVRSAGMGNALVGTNDRMYLYLNPGAFFQKKQKWAVDASWERYKIESAEDVGSLNQYNFAAGYRLFPRHAVFAGMRYWGGLSMPNVGTDLNTRKRHTSPFDYTLDFGYAYQLTDKMTVFATGSYISSYIGRYGVAWSFGAGITYQMDLHIGQIPAYLHFLLKASDLGTALDYGKSIDTALPGAVSGGVTLGFTPAEEHNLIFSLSDRYYVLPMRATTHFVSVGAEYGFKKTFFARCGYEQELRNNGFLTLGLGGQYRGVRLDASYRFATASMGSGNLFQIGMGFAL